MMVRTIILAMTERPYGWRCTSAQACEMTQQKAAHCLLETYLGGIVSVERLPGLTLFMCLFAHAVQLACASRPHAAMVSTNVTVV